MKEIHAKRKERASGKRLILKGKVVVSTEEVYKALGEAEKATAAKKVKKGKGQKGRKRKIVSESEEETSSLGDLDDFSDSDVEILDCIKVAG